ncbi:hypothetical protein UFOVP84_217 [uncultured Caudovirales phage]|uniref:Uncharacterized protein n=1 Tax=uncultured Caudovirales phage TaxID=2100421 RepID=A0A6J5KY57_9CAUD|nr:hypothetical protein UFOVP84_217 [uncultured Caudovirales phage]
MVKDSQVVFELIQEYRFTREDFKEWLDDYAEEILSAAQTASEVDLTPLREWANSDGPVWNSFEVGYETARSRARKLLGNASE